MKKIEINNKTYSLPDKLSEISLQEFLIIQEILQGENTGNLQKYIQIISYLSNIPESILRELKPDLISKFFTIIDSLANTEIENVDPVSSVKINEEVYYVNQNFSDSTFGEYIDYDNFLKQYGLLNSIPYLLTIILKRSGEKYSEYDPLTRVDLMKDLSADKALSIASFFLSKKEGLRNNTIYSLMLQETFQLKKEELMTSINKRVGTGLFSVLQKKISLRYIKLLHSLFPKYSHT